MRASKAMFDRTAADSLHREHRLGLPPATARAAASSRLAASPPPPLFVRVAVSGMESFTQFSGVRLIDAEHRAPDIFGCANVQPVREYVTHRQQTIESINELSGFQFPHSLEQSATRHCCPGQAEGFEKRYFAAAQVNLA